MEITDTTLPGVKVLTPRRFGDSRGYFTETWNRATLRSQGLDIDFVQDNESLSREAGTLRGLHYQSPPYAQTKLVRVITGSILDVAVDVRRGSPNFGNWVAVELSAENACQLLVPRGFLHGFLTLHPDTTVCYKVDNPYSAASDGAVSWCDSDLAINWGIDATKVHLSDKDAAAPALVNWQSPFDFDGAT